jgi:hypothetical protein
VLNRDALVTLTAEVFDFLRKRQAHALARYVPTLTVALKAGFLARNQGPARTGYRQAGMPSADRQPSIGDGTGRPQPHDPQVQCGPQMSGRPGG